MIEAYRTDNTDYKKNGDMPLLLIEAKVKVELNGTWALELEHPIDDEGRWKYLEEEAVVKCSSFNGDQLFRIKSIEKNDDSVFAKAYPIFFDSKNDCFLTDVRPTGKNGQDALNIMLEPNKKYSAQSDIARRATAYYEYMNLMEAINGDNANSFLSRWGGEILYDNFKIIVNERVGGDYGVELRYGKNIPANGITETVDMSEVVTRIYPKSYNGYKLSGNGYVDSPILSNYPTVKAATMKFDNIKMREDAQEDDEEKGIVVCDTKAELDKALTEACKKQFEAGLDKPKVTIEADMVLLQNTDQYKDYEILETVSLGDTIHCRHDKLGIISDARVVGLEYDCILNRVTSVVLGQFQSNYIDHVTSSVDKIDSVINSEGDIMAERVKGILDGITTQLRLQSTVAKKVNGRAFIAEDLDPNSPLYGCIAWGTQGIEIANRRTADGRDWDWSTAVAANGIIANAIVSGLLADKTGKNFWNLDTGEFRLSSESLKIDGQNIDAFKDEISNALKDGIIEEAEVESIEKYLNILNKDFESIKKQYKVIVDSMPSNDITGNNLKLTFSKECKTNVQVGGYKDDYIEIYYKDGMYMYQYKKELSGEEIAGQTLIFPEPEIYIKWHSDYGNNNEQEYYGFSIDTLELTTQPSNVEYESSTALYLPEKFINTKSKDMISTSHPYGFGENMAWRYKNVVFNKDDARIIFNAFERAKNALVSSITQAISDRKATKEEIEDINKKFEQYNTKLADLKEVLSESQMDIALGAADGAVSYSSANFKVQADQIKAEVSRATKEEEVLKSTLTLQAEQIKAEVERATEAEGNLKSSLTMQANMIESRVEKDKIGSYVQQYYDKVLIGFNNDSKYVQINPGQISIYDNGVELSKKRAVFDQNGNHFYRDGYYVGKIGTNVWEQDSSHKALVFDLETNGKYMSWSSREFPEDDFYTSIWTYSRANSIYKKRGLHAGAGIFLEGNYLNLDRDGDSYLFGGTGYINLHVNDHIKFRIGSQDRVRINYDSLYIYNGITAYNNTVLDFYSNLDMHNYAILNQSDARLKENIRSSDESALEKLMQLDILQYDWRETKEHVNMGMIAQQVQEAIPEAVKVSDNTGLYSINQIALIPYLVKAIQEMSGKPLPVSTYAVKTYTQAEIEKAMEMARPPVPEPAEEAPEPHVVKLYDIDKEKKACNRAEMKTLKNRNR